MYIVYNSAQGRPCPRCPPPLIAATDSASPCPHTTHILALFHSKFSFNPVNHTLYRYHGTDNSKVEYDIQNPRPRFIDKK